LLPSDIIALVVFCRLCYRLTPRDLSEIMLLRGFAVSHESIRRWEAKLLPTMGEALRKRRHGIGRRSGQSWYADETYLKVHGGWCEGRVRLCAASRSMSRQSDFAETMRPFGAKSLANRVVHVRAGDYLPAAQHDFTWRRTDQKG
jgi:hypothetical protein